MINVYKLIFEFLINPLGLPINPIYEYLILLAIAKLAFAIGWDKSPGGEFGSLIHYLYRTIAFFVLWALTYGGIKAYYLVQSNHLMIIPVIAVIALLVVLFISFNRIKSILKSY